MKYMQVCRLISELVDDILDFFGMFNTYTCIVYSIQAVILFAFLLQVTGKPYLSALHPSHITYNCSNAYRNKSHFLKQLCLKLG